MVKDFLKKIEIKRLDSRWTKVDGSGTVEKKLERYGHVEWSKTKDLL
jgi:hypothetical protein